MPHNRDLYSGVIRLHILSMPLESQFTGVALWKNSGGTAIAERANSLFIRSCTGLGKDGYLVSGRERDGKRSRRVYRVTEEASRVLSEAKEKVRELLGELLEVDSVADSGSLMKLLRIISYREVK